MSNRYDGKTVLVAGGSSGIGRATAERFAREGAHVVVLSNRADEVDQVCAELREAGLDVVGVPGDVSVAADADRAVTLAAQHTGRLDVLVSNAGFSYNEPFMDITEEHWDRLMAVNLKGMFLFGQRAARVMIDQGGGVILFTASVNGLNAESSLASYNASKAGVILLMKTMALELAPHRIRVNAVCPGLIDTPLTHDFITNDPRWAEYERSIPWGRPGRVDEVASLFAFLASDDAEYITGESIVIDGGQMASLVIPGLQDDKVLP